MASVLRRAESGPWSTPVTWSWWEAAVVVAVALVAGDVIRDAARGPGESDGAAYLGKILTESVWLVVLLGWMWARRHAMGSVVGWPRALRSEIVDAAVFGALLNGIVVVAVVLPLRALVDSSIAGDLEASTELRALSGAGIVVALAFVLLVAPVVEEFVFRGVVFRGVRDRHGPVVGVAVSSVAFGAIHWVPLGAASSALLAVATAIMGVGLSIQYERRRTLLAPIVAHVSFNTVGLLAALR